jgi:ABC-type dipeptide/oligopeptide/nickel transport system permease subunit
MMGRSAALTIAMVVMMIAMMGAMLYGAASAVVRRRRDRPK